MDLQQRAEVQVDADAVVRAEAVARSVAPRTLKLRCIVEALELNV